MSDARELQVAPLIQKALCAGGIPLQYAAIEASGLLSHARKSQWIFSVAEFPVSTATQETKIDFCLASKDFSIFLVMECKRAHPGYSSWAFLKAPYTNRECSEEQLLCDRVLLGRTRSAFRVETVEGPSIEAHAAHIAVPFKRQSGADVTNESGSNPRDEAEKAVGQAFRAANGLIESFRRHPDYEEDRPILVIPVVLTTASLMYVKTDLTR